ncbi:hypothetical protein [Pseudocitrobacter faecalis]|uniref:hypothetical protein n=1 Tax=Pseudocitrobacter faecalis TaxID=1398493 RepID=UPI0038998490
MKVKKFYKFPFVIALLSLSCSSMTSASGKYAFADMSGGAGSCSLGVTPFPISFKYDQGGGDLVYMHFNMFYVHDDVQGMDDYFDFYTNGENSGGEFDFWPSTPAMGKGNDNPQCTDTDLNENGQIDDNPPGYTEKCVTGVDSSNRQSYINKGVSDYSRILNMYPASGELKVVTDIVPTNGSRYKMLLDVRKIKYLRVEVFTPYTGSVAMHKGYVEPVYFEYIKDSNNWLKLTDSYGSTTQYITKEQLKGMLPDRINLNLLSDIRVKLDSYNGSTNFSSKVPNLEFVSLTPEQQLRVPDSCK